MTTSRKPRPDFTPAVAIEGEAKALVRLRFQGPVKAPPTAMLAAYTDLLSAAIDVQRAELFRLRKEGLTFAELAEVLGCTRQAVHHYLMSHGAGVQQKLDVTSGAGGRTNGGRSPKRPTSGGR